MNTYLAHHGILRMKWGIRRYQNADGSLTAAGKLRYGKSSTATKHLAKQRKVQKRQTTSAGEKTANPSDQAKPAYKPVNDMTDQEIRDFLNRRDLERRYLEAITPKQIEKSKTATQKVIDEFGSKLVSKFVDSAATEVNKRITKAIFGTSGSDNDKKKDKNKDD